MYIFYKQPSDHTQRKDVIGTHTYMHTYIQRISLPAYIKPPSPAREHICMHAYIHTSNSHRQASKLPSPTQRHTHAYIRINNLLSFDLLLKNMYMHAHIRKNNSLASLEIATTYQGSAGTPHIYLKPECMYVCMCMQVCTGKHKDGLYFVLSMSVCMYVCMYAIMRRKISKTECSLPQVWAYVCMCVCMCM